VTIPAPDNVKRILIRSVNWIGDAVMTTPAIGLIRQHFPQAEITVLANPLVGALFSHHEWIDQVLTFDRTGRHKGLFGRLRLAEEVRDKAFDLAIILPNSFDSALIPWLARIPARLGKSGDGRTLMLTDCYRPERQKPVSHEVDCYVELVRHFGISGSKELPQLFTTADEDRDAAGRLLKQNITAADFVIGVNPGATYGSAKRWYPDRFAEVARRLSHAWNAKIVVFGGPAETLISEEIEHLLAGNCCNLAGKTGVRELMALIKRCNFFITNDSGPMHLAAAFGVPLVAIFGSTDHATTSPYTDQAVVVRHPVDCAPCKLRECPTDHRCMTAVSAEEVVRAALKMKLNAPVHAVSEPFPHLSKCK
jgi:heptosyltransferase-2